MYSETFLMFVTAVGVMGFLAIPRLGSGTKSFRDTQSSESPSCFEKSSNMDRSPYGHPCQMGTARDIEGQEIVGYTDEQAYGSPLSTELLLRRTVSRLEKLLDFGSKSFRAKITFPASADLKETASEKTVCFAGLRDFALPAGKVTKSAPYIEQYGTPTSGRRRTAVSELQVEHAILVSAPPIRSL